MEKTNWQKRVADFWLNAVTERRRITLLLLVLVLFIGLFGLREIRFDDSYEALLMEDDQVMINQARFDEIFGEEQMHFILIESEDKIFTQDSLQHIKNLTETIEAELPFVNDVVSLTNIDLIDSQEESLVIRSLLDDEIPEDQAVLNRIESEVLNGQGQLNDLLTEDGQATGIIFTLQDIPEKVYVYSEGNFNHLHQEETMDQVILQNDVYLENSPNFSEVTEPIMLIRPALNAILAEYNTQGITETPTGLAIIAFERELLMVEEFSMLALLALVVSSVLLMIIFRSFRPLVGSILVILLTLIILFGAQGLLGINLTMQSLIVTILVMVIAVSYSIHFINHFEFKFKKTGARLESVYYAYKESTWPILITAVTTALGFVSFLLVPIAPIRIVGISSAAGAFITYLLVMTVLPLIYLKGKDRDINSVQIKKSRNFEKAMVRWADLVTTHLKTVVIISLALVILLIGGLFRINVNPDAMDMFGDGLSFVQDARYITDRLGFLYSYDVMIELPEEEMGRNAEVLMGMASFQEELQGYRETVMTASLVDLIKEMNMTMNGGNPDFYMIPDDDNLISQYLLMYEFAGGDGVDRVVDFGYENLRISVQISEASGEVLNNLGQIEEVGAQFFPEGTKITPVGEVAMMLRSLDHLSTGQIRSLFTAIIVITFIMMVILKSVKLGLLSMIPNAMPILMILGSMGLFGFSLDFVTIMLTPMILGIAVDDTVHYFLHFKEEFEIHGDYRKANQETFRKIGKALISTTVVLMLGFGILALVNIASFKTMGILAAVGIFTALVADMVIAPALVTYFKPYEEEK